MPGASTSTSGWRRASRPPAPPARPATARAGCGSAPTPAAFSAPPPLTLERLRRRARVSRGGTGGSAALLDPAGIGRSAPWPAPCRPRVERGADVGRDQRRRAGGGGGPAAGRGRRSTGAPGSAAIAWRGSRGPGPRLPVGGPERGSDRGGPPAGKVRRTLSVRDGLLDTEAWLGPSLAVGPDGAVYLGTPKGVSVYRPDLDRRSGRRRRWCCARPTSTQDRWGHNEALFEYAALSFTDERAVRYRTRLRGYDSDWSAPTTEVRTRYTNLRAFLVPRRYVFEVTAASAEGVWAEAPAQRELLSPTRVVAALVGGGGVGPLRLGRVVGSGGRPHPSPDEARPGPRGAGRRAHRRDPVAPARARDARPDRGDHQPGDRPRPGHGGGAPSRPGVGPAGEPRSVPAPRP